MFNPMSAINSFNAKPAPVFGGIIAWDLPVSDNKTLIDVREALVKVGLPENLMPERSHREALAMAIDMFEDKHEKSLLARKIRDDAASIVFGIVKEGKDKVNDKLHYHQETTINMSKETGTLTGDGEFFDEFRETYRWVKTHAQPVDLQKIMRQVVEMVKGIAYRHGGGTYFYAATDEFVVKTQAAAEFVKNLDLSTSHVSNIPLSGGPIQKAEVFYVAQEEIKKQIEGIRKAADNVTKRASSLSNHEGQLKDVAELMEYYVGLTKMEENAEAQEAEAKAMRDMIADTETFISKKMVEIEKLRKTA